MPSPTAAPSGGPGKRRHAAMGMLGGAVALIGVAVVMIATAEEAMLVVALACGIALAGLMLGSLGIKAFFEPEFGNEQRDAGFATDYPGLLRILKERTPPYWVCTRCVVVYDDGQCHGICHRCDMQVDCHHVETQEDVSMVEAVVS